MYVDGAEYAMDTCVRGRRGDVGLGGVSAASCGEGLVGANTSEQKRGRGEERAAGRGGEKRPPKAARDQGAPGKGQARRGEQSRLGMGRGAEGGEGRSLRVGEGSPRAT